MEDDAQEEVATPAPVPAPSPPYFELFSTDDTECSWSLVSQCKADIHETAPVPAPRTPAFELSMTMDETACYWSLLPLEMPVSRVPEAGGRHVTWSGLSHRGTSRAVTVVECRGDTTQDRLRLWFNSGREGGGRGRIVTITKSRREEARISGDPSCAPSAAPLASTLSRSRIRSLILHHSRHEL